MASGAIKSYIRYIADCRPGHLGLPRHYGIGEHPLPWLTEILNGVEHATFFEARATDYSKAASRGAWHGEAGAWAAFDRPQDRRTATPSS